MNCINCGTEMPELANGVAQCNHCGTTFKNHARGNTGALLTMFFLGDEESPPTPQEMRYFKQILQDIAMKEGNNYICWHRPLIIEQFDIYPDIKEKENE